MKRFRFSLEAVLTLRQRVEQRALENYAARLLTRRRALEQLAALEQEQLGFWEHWRSGLAQGCPAATLSQWREYDGRLKDKQEQMQTALRQAELAANQALQEMLAARQQREAVEKHRQTQRAQHARELSVEEQKILDELANRRVQPLQAGRASRLPNP